VTGGRARRPRQLLDDLEGKRVLEFETGSTRSHSMEDSFLKRQWTCRKTLQNDDARVFIQRLNTSTSGGFTLRIVDNNL
jgi:hypothetical protein